MTVPTYTGAIGVAFASIAVGSFAATKTFAEIYGMPVRDESDAALYRALGARDLVLGAIVVAAERSGATNVQLAGTIALSALAGVADFTIVASTPSAKKSRLVLHGGGTLGLFVVAALVALTPDRPDQDAPQEPVAAKR